VQHSATHYDTLQRTATHCNTAGEKSGQGALTPLLPVESSTTLQHTATHYNTLQHTAAHCNTQQHAATRSTPLQHAATHSPLSPVESSTTRPAAKSPRMSPPHKSHMSPPQMRSPSMTGTQASDTLQHTAAHCNTLQHTATHCHTLQHTATHCNTCHTLQHTGTRCNAQIGSPRMTGTIHV